MFYELIIPIAIAGLVSSLIFKLIPVRQYVSKTCSTPIKMILGISSMFFGIELITERAYISLKMGIPPHFLFFLGTFLMLLGTEFMADVRLKNEK